MPLSLGHHVTVVLMAIMSKIMHSERMLSFERKVGAMDVHVMHAMQGETVPP